ncbi:hypothetical protein BH09VER1_BH09VER1_49510 [soil metagenome]
MARTALASLGPVRRLPTVEACALRDVIWLRGGTFEKNEQREMDALPWKDRYEIVSGRYLRPRGCLLPTGRIPTCAWVPIATFIQPTLVVPLLPGNRPTAAPLLWRPATSERAARYLLARGVDWLAFAERAALVRLQHLRFAQCADGQSVIAGTPLPALPGTYFYEEDGVAFPAGYEIQPRLSRATWARLLQCGGSDLAFVQMDGAYSVIAASAWVKASRSAVRLSVNPQAYV